MHHIQIHITVLKILPICQSILIGVIITVLSPYGLSVKTKPSPPVEGNAYLISETELTLTCEQAQNSF